VAGRDALRDITVDVLVLGESPSKQTDGFFVDVESNHGGALRELQMK
jgi:hypothetical protein